MVEARSSCWVHPAVTRRLPASHIICSRMRGRLVVSVVFLLNERPINAVIQ